MIDRYMVWKGIRHDTISDPIYSPEQAVLGHEDSGLEGSSRLAVIFPPWHSHLDDPALKSLARKLGSNGFSVRRYDFNDHILEPNVDRVVESFQNIRDRVAEELEKHVDEKGFNQVHFISASLGTVSLALVASRFTRLTGATIVAGSSNLALSMWNGIRTVNIRQAIEETEGPAFDDTRIDEAWHGIAPKTHADAFKGIPVRMKISTTDEIIPTVYQIEMANVLAEAGCEVDMATTRLGHYAAIGSYCYLDRNLS
jgi:hypothetical protein